MKQKNLLLILFLAMVLVLSACGGGGDTSQDNDINENASQGTENGEGTGDASANSITISATNWDFDKEEYIVKSGEPVTIHFKSVEGVHGIGIEGTEVQNILDDGQQEVTLEPGEYRIYCSIPCGQGHADMTATLVVQ